MIHSKMLDGLIVDPEIGPDWARRRSGGLGAVPSESSDYWVWRSQESNSVSRARPFGAANVAKRS